MPQFQCYGLRARLKLTLVPCDSRQKAYLGSPYDQRARQKACLGSPFAQTARQKVCLGSIYAQPGKKHI